MKSNNNIVIAVIIILAVLLLSNHSLNNLKPGSGIPFQSELTITGISPTKTISNDNDLASANFLISAVVNNGGQSIVGTIDSTKLKGYTGLSSSYPLQISLTNVKETLRYDITNEGQLYKYDINTSEPFDWEINAPSHYVSGYSCVIKTIPGKWYAGNTYQTVCVKDIPTGQYGYFQKPQILWTGQITMSVNGKSITRDIGTLNTGVEFSDNSGWLGNAKWVGSLMTGTPTPQENAYKAVIQTGSSAWGVAKVSTYQTYADSLISSRLEIKRLMAYSSVDSQTNNVLSVVNAHNALYSQLINENSAIQYASGLEALTPESAMGNTIVVSTNNRIANPSLAITVKASELGILIPVGKPSIVSITSPTFASGSNNGYAIVTVKNIGTATGTFGAVMTETSGTFTQSGTAPTVQLAPGTTGTIRVEISHDTNAAKTSKIATMEVYDVNKRSNSATSTFTISMTVPKKCTPLTTRQDGKTIWTCNSDGMGETMTLDCTSTGLDYVNGKYKCIVNPTVGTSSGTSTGTVTGADKDSLNVKTIKWYETPTAYALGILLVITGILLYMRTNR